MEPSLNLLTIASDPQNGHGLTSVFPSSPISIFLSDTERVAIRSSLVGADYERACTCITEELAGNAVVQRALDHSVLVSEADIDYFT